MIGRSRRTAQDTNAPARARPRLAAAVAALLAAAVLASCVQPPRERLATPYGLVRAETRAQAEELASVLRDLHPRVRGLLPDMRDRSTEVWLDAGLGGSRRGEGDGVAALTDHSSGRIKLRGDATGIRMEFLLAHELVHALLGRGWFPLPAVAKEGLCDAVAAQLVPQAAPLARALRLFAARFAFGDQVLDAAFTEPGFGARRGTSLTISAPGLGGQDLLEALEIAGPGVPLSGDAREEDALYGFGLLVVERSARRLGWPGLHELCLRAAAEGHSVVPAEWLLWAAALGTDPASWERALADELGPAELRALSGHLAASLAPALAANLRYRFPDAAEPPAGARLALGLRGSDLELPIEALPELESALAASWQEARPPALRPGATHWYADREGVHLATYRPASADGVPQRLVWLLLGETSDPGSQPLEKAAVEAWIEMGRDERGPWIASALPEGFRDFRLEMHGVAIAELRWSLNVQREVGPDGWTTLRCRLDPAFDPEGAVLYAPEPNLVLSQRALEGGGELRLPFRLAPEP